MRIIKVTNRSNKKIISHIKYRYEYEAIRKKDPLSLYVLIVNRTNPFRPIDIFDSFCNVLGLDRVDLSEEIEEDNGQQWCERQVFVAKLSIGKDVITLK